MTTTNQLEPWLAYYRPNPQARLRLFCFPYAGGSASIFRTWANDLPGDIEVCPIQLPGRERRLRETPYKRMTALVTALSDALPPMLDKPFAFFGHSMGALISFELTRELRRRTLPQPVHIFVSGARPPHIPDPEPHVHHLPEKEFIQALRAFDGTPEQVLQHEELMQILLPCLRADFEICETNVSQPEEPLAIPMTVFGGWQDKKIGSNELEAWRDLTSSSCVIHMFAGDHFFLHNQRQQLLQIVSNSLH